MVYTSRNQQLLRPLFDDYSRESSVAVSYVSLRPQDLISQLAIEGEQSPADVVVLTGAAYLWNAAERSLLAAVQSRILEKTSRPICATPATVGLVCGYGREPSSMTPSVSIRLG